MTLLHPFAPQTWPFAWTDLPPGGYLVGGAVRDGLLQRNKNHWDLDIVLPLDVIPVGRHLAKKYHTGFVILDAERCIVRLIFPELTLDLSQMCGQDIFSDLSQRDFTINAMAWDYHNEQLYDPYNGQNDLHAKTLRQVHPDNLRHDPLRLLRGYRLAAQLDFEIEWMTRQTMRNFAPFLIHVAPERVQNELTLLLENPHSSPHVLAAWQDGVLTPWFPDIHPHWLRLLPRWDHVLESHPQLAPLLHQQIRQGRSVLTTLKLRCLLPEDHQIARRTLTQLHYSRAEIHYLEKVITLWPVWQPLLTPVEPPIPVQFDFFQRAGSVLPALVAIALIHDYPWSVVAVWFNRFTNPDDPVAHALPLVTGHDLIHHLHLSPGPQVGELLHQLAQAHAQGEINTPTAALELATQLSSRQPFGSLKQKG